MRCNVSERVAIKILGTPLGHHDFFARHLEGVLDEQRVSLSRVPLVNDIQSAWLLFLYCYCQSQLSDPPSHARERGVRSGT